jgi:hypothetical protein
MWFVSLRSAVGSKTMDGSTIVAVNKFYVEDIGRARNHPHMAVSSGTGRDVIVSSVSAAQWARRTLDSAVTARALPGVC